MRNLIVGLVIFAAGVGLGWFAQQRYLVAPSDAEVPSGHRPSLSPLTQAPALGDPGIEPQGARLSADLRVLLEQGNFAAAIALYDDPRAFGDQTAREYAREQILAHARKLLGAGRYSLVERLLLDYLLAVYRDVEARMLLADAYAGRSEFRAAVDQLYEARGYAWQPERLARLTRRIRATVAAQVQALRSAADYPGLLEFYQHLTQLDPAHAAYFIGLADAQLALDDGVAARRSLQLVVQDVDVGHEARARLEALDREALQSAGPDPAAAPARVLGVPLHRSGNHFLVDARVAGAGSVRLLIDTGASMTILTPNALAGLGDWNTGESRVFSTANGRVKAPLYRLDALEVGEWQVSELDVGVLELPDSPHIDGLLGMNFLRHFQFFIDQNEALLRLSLDKR
jgi:clan AA aspartic protease (TIGR02281 family)